MITRTQGHMRHIIRSQQFDTGSLSEIFDLTDEIRDAKMPHGTMQRKILVSLFYEPSTRTRLSFESSMIRLGGRVIGTENAREFSSAIKGESLEDSVRVMGGYGDVIVLRHFEDDAAERAAAISKVPIINAGCGKSQHPTQALLDLYTIWRELRRRDGISVALVGDLKYGRTIRSLAYLLAKFPDVEIHFVSPSGLRVESDIPEYLDRHGVRYEEWHSLRDVIGIVDVVYMTRVQKERMPGGISGMEMARIQETYRIDEALARRMKKDAIIMHPLPRNNEIAWEVDELPQAAYFRQAENGLYVRMALLEWIFS